MHKTSPLTLLVALALFSTPALAQEGRIGQVYFMEVAPENNAEWLEAYGKHVDFHRQNNDDWAWPVWQITSGPRTGQYAIGTFGHEWQDFDRDFEAKDVENAWRTMVPLSKSYSSEYWIYFPDRSRPPESLEHSLLVLQYNRLKAGMGNQYWRANDKINAALKKANWHRHSLTSIIVNSGQNGWVVRASPRSGFAEMGRSPGFVEAMTEAYGEDEFEAIMSSSREAVEESYSEVWTFMPELSYAPGN